MTRITEMEHKSHSGHLLKLGPPAEPFKCNACEELGFGPRFTCEHKGCNFHLHEECADPAPHPSHRLFPGCQFTLLSKSDNRVCDACGRDIRGISYRCSHSDTKRAHDAHPCCLSLPPCIVADDGGVQLSLVKHVSSKCGKCGRKEAARKVEGWSYSSSCGNYCFHVACVKEMIIEKFKNGYFNEKFNVDSAAAGTGYDWLSLPPMKGDGSGSSSSSNALARTQNGGGMFGKKGKMVLKIVNVILKLIISAVFGNPTAGVAILIESLSK